MGNVRLQEEDDLPGRGKPKSLLARRALVTVLYLSSLVLTAKLRWLGEWFEKAGHDFRLESLGGRFSVLGHLYDHLGLVLLCLTILWGLAQAMVASRQLWLLALFLTAYTLGVGWLVADVQGFVN